MTKLDIAIGAPYENERGAIYIYYGERNGINSIYAQVRNFLRWLEVNLDCELWL